jgi:trehalose 6-phosphate phosphatase
VGVGGVAYAGSHGAELLEPGSTTPRVAEAFKSWEGQVKAFMAERDTPELRSLRIRIEDKGPIMTFHWRGAPDEDRARTYLEGVAQEAETAGLATHWGRKVLEIRPPVPVNKGQAVRDLVLRTGVRTALFGGDDVTDLDGFAALTALVEEGKLDDAVRVGVRSEEGPPEIVREADLVVDGIEGFQRVLAELDAA